MKKCEPVMEEMVRGFVKRYEEDYVSDFVAGKIVT